MSFKTHFIERMLAMLDRPTPKVLELACGSAEYMETTLNRYPGLSYVGIEPHRPSFAKAQKNIGSWDNVALHNLLGYERIPEAESASFDLVFSLSALEHIKNLKNFIENSARYLKPGGMMVHRYDLGHALYPSSFKERIQVFLGNNAGFMLPEHKFVRYLSQDEVVELSRSSGCNPFLVTYHQMPSHKSLEKAVRRTASLVGAMQDIYAWEWEYRREIAEIPLPERERMFPAVAVWSTKA